MKKSNFPMVKLDDNLKKVLGDHEMLPSQHCVKQLWAYIKSHNLIVK